MNKATQDVMFASGKGDHRTPVSLFHQLNEEFNFTLDVAADKENTLCKDFLSEKNSAFDSVWASQNWCNPPYGRGIVSWVNRASEMKRIHNCGTVMLLPSRTDTRWFHTALEYIDEIRFIKGRLKFQGEDNGAPFPSLLLIWWDPGKSIVPSENGSHHWYTVVL